MEVVRGTTFHSVHEEGSLYFITATVVGWKELFWREEYANIILSSLVWLREYKKIELFAFVLMPHHLHALMKPVEGATIGNVLQKFGSFTAHELLKALRKNKEASLLEFFQNAAVHKKSKEEHHLWQQIQAKNVYSEKVILQKMEYIHNNPVAKHWQLAEERWEYRYSSACYYDKQMEPIIAIDDVAELFE
ncbi:MAG: hypothetical protein EPO24_12975 [Bacteroidetes bacterium]|nr:MAG: hypothetical protein EPO24_12975 [Bacteroidota bacterium]